MRYLSKCYIFSVTDAQHTSIDVLAELLRTAAHANHLPIKKEQAAVAAVARNHHVSRMEVAVH
jgi:hypothetical protein